MRTKAFRLARGLIAGTVLALLPVACAPKTENTETTPTGKAEARETALVRFVNATTYTEPVDVYVDEMKVIPAIEKDKVTDYSEWNAERHEIGVRPAGNNQQLATNSEGLSAGKHYTVVGYTKIDGTPGVAVFPDDKDKPEAGKAGIRLIHVADGADDLAVYPAGGKDSLVNGVDYDSDSFVQVDPGVRSLEIRKGNEKITTLKIPELSLQPGQTYTIVVATDQNRKLHAIQLDNTLPAEGANR